MAHTITSQNNSFPSDTAYLTISAGFLFTTGANTQVALAGDMLSEAAYTLVSNSNGTTVTFQTSNDNGVTWRALANPAPIVVQNNTTYNGLIPGLFHALRINISTGSGARLAFGELSAKITA